MTILFSPKHIDWYPETTDLNPDPQTWLTIWAGFETGTPAPIEAYLAGFWPSPEVKTCPIITSSISSKSNFDL